MAMHGDWRSRRMVATRPRSAAAPLRRDDPRTALPPKRAKSCTPISPSTDGLMRYVILIPSPSSRAMYHPIVSRPSCQNARTTGWPFPTVSRKLASPLTSARKNIHTSFRSSTRTGVTTASTIRRRRETRRCGRVARPGGVSVAWISVMVVRARTQRRRGDPGMVPRARDGRPPADPEAGSKEQGAGRSGTPDESDTG